MMCAMFTMVVDGNPCIVTVKFTADVVTLPDESPFVIGGVSSAGLPS